MTIQLKNMPEDVRDYVLKIQGEIKRAKKLGKYSQQKTIYHILRDHMIKQPDHMSTYKSEE